VWLLRCWLLRWFRGPDGEEFLCLFFLGLLDRSRGVIYLRKPLEYFFFWLFVAAMFLVCRRLFWVERVATKMP